MWLDHVSKRLHVRIGYNMSLQDKIAKEKKVCIGCNRSVNRIDCIIPLGKVCGTCARKWKKANVPGFREHISSVSYKYATRRRASAKSHGKCHICGETAVVGLSRCVTHRDMYNAAAKARGIKIKIDAMNAYGGCKCNCPPCGETILSGLNIDHINGGGTQHRKKVGNGGYSMYRWLKNNNYPPGFQVLCATCNLSRQLNMGVCEHIK